MTSSSKPSFFSRFPTRKIPAFFFSPVLASWSNNGIHSLRSLPYERAITSFKASSPLSAIWCFLLQVPVSSSFPQGRPLAAYLFFFVFSSLYLSSNNLVQYEVPEQDVTINDIRLPPPWK